MVATPNRPVNKTRVRISKSGQITLPARIRRKLGVELGEQVELVEAPNGTITVQPARILSLDEIAGLAKPLPPGENLEELLHEARRVGSIRERYRAGSMYDDPD